MPFTTTPRNANPSTTCHSGPRPLPSPIYSENHALQVSPSPNTNAYLLSTMLIYGRQSKWIGGYRNRLDIQPSAPYRTNSDWVSTLTAGFGVERS
ncbi:hypothetical protein AVEN_248192-1 [Araneus ventricosus]|uniref:Uncharacterized protein n=1 Tax=Araneus ventricosus TaxID=182803 RepID=A0A4Y2X3I2_ARAVE|nr:hypothetical protein AVEN_248192-1 [Araneus ventricosus]